MSTPTASQTVGPFFSIGMSYRNKHVADPAPEDAILITGTIFDGEGVPVQDAQLELWQANAAGVYERFSGFTRISMDEHGAFALQTVMPGRVAGPQGTTQAPHIVVTLFMRGLLRHLHTRIYFADHPDNENDPVLSCVPNDKRTTLLARQVAGSPRYYRWDVYLQGEQETVFFAY